MTDKIHKQIKGNFTMIKAMTFMLLAIACLANQPSAHASSITTGRIQFTFESKDGLPVEGVVLAGILHFDALSLKNCSGFICLPGIPSYHRTGEAAVLLGGTDANGLLVVEPRAWETSSLSARNLAVTIFTNGLIKNICKNGTQSQGQDLLQVLPQFIDQQPYERNPECQNVEVTKGDSREQQIRCFSPYTSAEIVSMKEKILSACPQPR